MLRPLQLEEMRKNEDPRLSFSTPEFKEAQRVFTDNFKVRFWCCPLWQTGAASGGICRPALLGSC